MIFAVLDVWIGLSYTVLYNSKFFTFNICCFIKNFHINLGSMELKKKIKQWFADMFTSFWDTFYNGHVT